MAETTGTSFLDIKVIDRHGAGVKGQASDGTGTSGNLPKFNADGSLTDSGVAASGIGGGSGATQFSEIPAGTMNGTNVTFTLSHTPVGSGSLKSLHCYLNGVYQDPNWISLSGTTITFVAAPTSADQMYAEYEY